ncbi:GyrI-like domain-containing protein [Stenotrophomonas sp. SY1]|uniref:GyrI-like domain-containing protein n=1 Tax=Stenotrophomonas sp. SY1 TaxID=477235 RepID=UPI001E3B00D5|nr:GyrI-like domain-containing protein [Stenotrophomonas sp. SY1]MCD9086366.1 GyrI-like domain-containing protein [Stenotrophomonas sp. SY1]
MLKIDTKKDYKHLYQASSRTPTPLDVPSLRYLMIDGQGDPNTTPAYAQAVEALFSVSYTARFLLKKGPRAIDYAVMPLEGLWWSDDLSAFERNDRSRWQWTMMIMQPDIADDATLMQAIADVRRKKALPAIDALRLDTFTEGSCAQLLHVGPFSEEGPTIQRLHDFIATQGTLRGKHHEIYLSDIRRAAPERWKTIIRQPLQPHGDG